MHFTPSFFAYAAMLLGAICMAGFFERKDRVAAFGCAALLLASWLMNLSSYNKGWEVESLFTSQPNKHFLDAWAAETALIGFGVILLAVRNPLTYAEPTKWGMALYGFLMLDCFNDCLYWGKIVSKGTFHGIADACFILELSIFYAMGGRGAINFLVDYGNRCNLFIPIRVMAKKTRVNP